MLNCALVCSLDHLHYNKIEDNTFNQQGFEEKTMGAQ